jgi:hypothetical protein
VTPAEVLATVVRPALAWMGSPYASPEAEVMLLAVQRQEDPGCTRCQAGGPARGLWQFELTGVQAVRYHERTAIEANRIAVALDLPSASSRTVYSYLAENDRLACAFARLLLWALPDPLPRRGESGVAWAQYVKAWRPGKPRPLDWIENYAAALDALTAAEGRT